MSKIKNCLSVLCHNKKDTKSLSGYRWASFLIFQCFIALLLVVQPNAWAGLSSLTVDANGDNVFNGDQEKLTITFTTDDLGADPDPAQGQDGVSYQFKITVEYNSEKTILSGPTGDDRLSKNQTFQYIWDGTYLKVADIPDGDREKLPDGNYTITVTLTHKDGAALNDTNRELNEIIELTADVTFDETPPEVTISIDDDAFSPILYSLPVYYDINEDVAEAWLEIQKAPGDANIGRPIVLSTSAGSNTYYWDGDDNNRRAFFDGQYTLRLRVIDKGGNETVTGKTPNITIDTEEPLINSLTINDSITLTDGKFVNTIVETINFTADDPDGTGVNLTGRDTDVLIRPVGGRDISGALSFGNKINFVLGDVLDDIAENGEYEVTVFVSDNVGNLASERVRFTFDNTLPILSTIATQLGAFTPGSGIKGETNYVEATLEDNIELNLANSTIRLKGPDGSDLLGQQSNPTDNKIRWQLLSPLSTTDGVHDGQYTVEIVAADKAGNQTAPIQIGFIFDNLAPEIVSLNPARDADPFNIVGDTTYYNLPLNQIVVTYDDGEFGTGVIFSGAQDISRIVFGTPNADGGINTMQGRAFPDQNNNVLTFILNRPLINRDGSQDGEYRFNVTAADKLGNIKEHSFRLVYDTQVPTLVSTVPAANQSVTDLSEVVVNLNETTSGIDFLQSSFVLRRSDGENQVDVPVQITSNGTDTATLTLLQPIALDGSDDGTYTIEVTPTDRAGNVGAVAKRTFYLVSQARPQVRLTAPETSTVNSLGDITVQLTGYIGSGINFDDSNITVIDPQAQIVAQSMVDSDAANNLLTWSTETAIPQNGSADGRYTVSVSFIDYAGVRYTQIFYLKLDTQSPTINTVQVATDPQQQLTIDTTTDVSESFSQININFDGTDVDFDNTTLSLVDPDGNEIAVRKSNDGQSVLTLDFQNLSKLGSYVLTITPIDTIGNISESPYVYRLNLDVAVPIITSVTIGGKTGGIVYVNGDVADIVATIVDTTGGGIAVGTNDSNIVVTSLTGLPVPGTTTIDDNNQLIWRPALLPADGSADGQYTVAITPIDREGRTGDVAYRSFIYDTQSPRITAATPITLHQPISYVGGGLTQFQFTVEDVGPALLELDSQTIALRKNSGESVEGQITHDDINQLFFTLTSPLPTDGSADGEYTLTVDLTDKAGNTNQVQHSIIYDSQAPQLSSVLLNTETPLNLTPYQVTDLSESISRLTLSFVEMTRVDFDNTTIMVSGPDGSTVPLSLENNGTDEITASFVALIQGGLYTLSVTPQDIAGNAAQGAVPYPFMLKFEVPGITSIKANAVDTSFELTTYEIKEISDTVSSFTLEFTDATRIDFENTSVALAGPDTQQNPVTLEVVNGTQFLVRFVPLTQSGHYTLTVTPQDIAGNAAQSPVRYQFRLDISLPSVSSVTIDGKEGTNLIINNPNVVLLATFADTTSLGLAFGDSGSNITVNSADGIEVSGISTTNGENQLTWTPVTLPTDGSADGRYTITVTPVDRSGRSGTTVTRHFIYDTQAPRITDAIPIILHHPKSYIGQSLTQFEFSVEDVGPALLDLDDQTITLENMNDEPVAGQVTHDDINRLFFTLSTPLPTDGSADGEYTITINLVDKAGNVHEVQHNIHYDSQVPQISSVTLNTETPMNLTAYQVTDLSESINKLTLSFVETTRVDFAATVVTLSAPDGSSIPLTLENNGLDQLSVSFVSLTQGGVYTLFVTPQDVTGNVPQGAISYPFRVKFIVPGLANVTANTDTDAFELNQYEIVESSNSISSFVLGFTDPLRIDLEETTVTLTGPDGQEVPIILEGNDDNQLIVRFVPLTQSGEYNLSIIPQDIDGNVAQKPTSYSFKLEFVVPGLVSVTANTADASLNLTPYQEVQLSEVVTGFTLEFTNQSRVDYENTNVVLTDPDGQQIPVTLEEAENGNLNVLFVALEQSGLYTVAITLRDVDGNVTQGAVLYPFELMFDVPAITVVTAKTENGALTLTPYETIELSDAVSGFTIEFMNPSRIDYENTSVVLTDANGEQIPVTLEEAENGNLNVLFVALDQGGMYTVAITLRDIDGNATQGAVLYPFELMFAEPAITTVSAITEDEALVLTPYETNELSNIVSGLTIELLNPSRVDYENTSVVLTDADGQQIPVTLEEAENGNLNVLFVALDQGGMYTVAITLRDIDGNATQGSVLYPFELMFAEPAITTVSAITEDEALALTPYETNELSDIVSGLTIELLNPSRVDYENTSVVLTNANGEQIPVTLEEAENGNLNVLFVALDQGGMYTVAITLRDIDGNATQGAVLYPFELMFAEPAITTVSAITEDEALTLIPYETNELSNIVSGLTIELLNPSRVDYENTSVVLTDADGQQIPVTLEEAENGNLNVLFVALDQGGMYTVAITLRDIDGNATQGAVLYPFELMFAEPAITTVSAITEDEALALTPYETNELSATVSGFTIEFMNPSRVDYENTSVVLTDADGEQIPVTLEEAENGNLNVLFVALDQGGMYTVAITLRDIDGNATQGAVLYPFELMFAEPAITTVSAITEDEALALTPYETNELSNIVSGLTIELLNPSRVDYENTSVVLTDADGQQIPVTLEEAENGNLNVLFVALDQGGMYTVAITLRDIDGNATQGAVLYPFELMFAEPAISSVSATTENGALTLTPYETNELSDAVSGFTIEFMNPSRVDYENTSVVLTDADGQQIPVTLEESDNGTLNVLFVALDQGGMYTVAITLRDIDGNATQGAVQYPFELMFAEPAISSVSATTENGALTLTPYETNELSDAVNGFTIEFMNPSRVDYENTGVVLTNANGEQIPVTLEESENGNLNVRFVSVDQNGMYTVAITLRDVDGNATQGAVLYPFELMFEVPRLVSVTANTDNASLSLIQHEIIEISESVSSLTLAFTDADRLDFENTDVTLNAPNDQEIIVTLEEDEDYQLVVRFVALTQSGIYTLSVTPQDTAGNVAQRAVQYQFKLDTTLPTVNYVIIDGKQGATIYVRNAIPRVIANLADSIGVGLAIGDAGSTIVVTNSQGEEVSGTTTLTVSNQLTWTPTPLPVDGSADGEYTVIVTPVDKTGRSGTAVRRQFIYDTQAPRITSATPITLHAPMSYIGGGLNQFVLTIEDLGPAGIVFDTQVVALLNAAGRPVAANLTYDELASQLYLTLAQPFATDGSADGPYTLNVLLSDKAGNQLSSKFSLVYDSKIPEVSTVHVNTLGTTTELLETQVAELNESIDTITIKFTEATLVDFANTTVSLLDPSGAAIPFTKGDDGVSQLTLNFVPLTQIGQYTLQITPQDVAGNAAENARQYAFNLEFILPDVASVVIGETVTLSSTDVVYVNAENLVIVANLLDPAGTGLSFDANTGSDIIVATLEGIIIPGSIATNGVDTLVWNPVTLSSDGTTDGRYAVYVYAVDKQGREANVVYREFILDTQAPEITDATPIDLSQPVSYIGESLIQLQFTIQDVGPADLILADQTVTLRNQNGVLIPTQLTNDTNSQLYLTLNQPLPLDGSQDGQYMVEIAFSDKAGNVLSINHPIVYDTQAPTVVSTVPADSELLTEDVTQIQVNLDDKGDSGIDWALTTVTLVDPNGTVITGDLTSNGSSQVTLKTNQLVADGRYVIQVQAIDRAGNGTRTVHETDFLLSRRLPAIVTTVPSTAPADEAYTNQAVDEIEVLIETADTRHLSTVILLNADGQVVAGQQHRESGKLIYRLVRPLSTDGSEDGFYTIEFTPISSSGRTGEAQSLTFTYDTQSPELESRDVHLIVSEPQVDNSLISIRMDITDNQAGVDWENLETDWVTFERISPNEDDIDGKVLYVSGEPEHLLFTLNVPLADDGSADGTYKVTVTPIDRAGNGNETYEKEFTYDTSPPEIDPNSLLINDAPLLTDIDAEDYPSAVSTTGGVVIQAVVSDTGLGVNLSQSRIVVINPNGEAITGTTRQNGVDTLVFKSDGLNVEGVYQVTITATGNDAESLGITPQGSVTAEFLYETTVPTAVVLEDGGKTELTDEALPLEGTAADPQGVRRAGPQGDNEIPVPASGVWLVEVIGTGPDGQPIEPVPAEDESDAQQEPWSRWSVDFLPSRSGDYDLDIRVTDKAGNFAVYDYGEVTMSVSFSFSGNTFVWPNPLRHSKDDVGFFSYDLNTSDNTVKLTVYIYDWSGDMVYSKTYANISPEHRNGNEVSWRLKNNAGNRVARGIYVFRLEAVDGAGNRANAVGKMLVVD